MTSTQRSTQLGSEIIEFLIVLPFMLAVFFLLLELGIGFVNQAVLSNASRAAVLELVRGRSDSDATAAAERVMANALANYKPMIAWATSMDPDVQLARDEQCDGTQAGTGRPWMSVTITYTYRIPGIPAFLPGSLSQIPLSACTTMRSFNAP
jgi:Flp pilus assembly protein TadG